MKTNIPKEDIRKILVKWAKKHQYALDNAPCEFSEDPDLYIIEEKMGICIAPERETLESILKLTKSYNDQGYSLYFLYPENLPVIFKILEHFSIQLQDNGN